MGSCKSGKTWASKVLIIVLLTPFRQVILVWEITSGKASRGKKISSKIPNRCSTQQEIAFPTWDPTCKKKLCGSLHFEKNPRWEKIILCSKDTTERPKWDHDYFPCGTTEKNLGLGSPFADDMRGSSTKPCLGTCVRLAVFVRAAYKALNVQLVAFLFSIFSVGNYLHWKLFTPKSHCFPVSQQTSYLLGYSNYIKT